MQAKNLISDSSSSGDDVDFSDVVGSAKTASFELAKSGAQQAKLSLFGTSASSDKKDLVDEKA